MVSARIRSAVLRRHERRAVKNLDQPRTDDEEPNAHERPEEETSSPRPLQALTS